MPPVFGTAVLMINILFFLLTTWKQRHRAGKRCRKAGARDRQRRRHHEVRAQYSGFFLAAALVLHRLSLRSALATDIVCCSRRRVRRLARRPSGQALHSMEVVAGYGPPYLALYASTPFGSGLGGGSLRFGQSGQGVRALAHEISPLPAQRFRIRQTAPRTHQMLTKQAPTHEYKYVPTDFGNIAYREAGSGPAAIFVHGVLLNGHFWDRLIEAARGCQALHRD